VIRNINALNL